MKLAKFSIIFILLPFICSCTNNNKLVLTRNGNLINNATNINEASVKINANKLDLLISSNETFAFYYYSTNCESCVEASASIINYVNNSNSLIYSASLDDLSFASYLNVQSKYKDVLKEGISFPYFVLINDGKLYSEVTYNVLSNKSAFNNYMNKNFDNKNIYQTFNCKDTKRLIDDNAIKYVYYYEKDDELSNKVLKELYKYCGNNKLIVVDELSFLTEQDLADIHAYSGVSTNHGPEVVKYNNTMIVNRFKINSENINAINEIF